MNARWKVVAPVLGIVIVAVLVLSYLGINSYFQFPSAYTKVVVPSGNMGFYTYSGTYATTSYTFEWGFPGPVDVFSAYSISYVKDSISPSNQNRKSYPVSLNATYEMGSESSVYGGIEIKVSEVHSDYIVLLVKPL